jgi:hypothetical protein
VFSIEAGEMGRSKALADIDWNAAKEVIVIIEVHLVLRFVHLGWLGDNPAPMDKPSI